jgi:hypothetical protein
MILSPIAETDLPEVLETFARALPEGSAAAEAFARLRLAVPRNGEIDTAAHRAAAVALARRLGMATLAEEPTLAFSWDGQILRTESEAWVILHEIGHFQTAPPQRRHLIDFGLGAGPETGRIAEADAACASDRETGDREEQIASLLGILWEEALGQPALLALQEHNWLEGWNRAGGPAHFTACMDRLSALGLVDAQGRPLPNLRD